jgi:hypothetical protein
MSVSILSIMLINLLMAMIYINLIRINMFKCYNLFFEFDIKISYILL